MTATTFSKEPHNNKVYYDTVFMNANRHISDHWVRIGELYPEGVNKPLLPAAFKRQQFGQGNHCECFMLTALSTLVRVPDVIQNCFVSKNVRRDGRYTFQFFRGEQWMEVEIDDFIPLEDGEVLYMKSPTEHWWPLLLEKAYAKFYTGYENLEGCTLQEVYHDMTGCPVLSIPMDARLAKAAGADVMDGGHWLDLAQRIRSGQVVASVLTNDMKLENMGLQRAQQYGILEIFSLTGGSSVSDIVVRLHNPFEDEEFLYTGPLNSEDPQWTPELRARYAVDDEQSAFIPLRIFHKIINSMQLCYMCSIENEVIYFDDEWKGKTAGGNPTCVTWRNNPLYTVRNASARDTRFLVMIKQGDKRHSVTGDDEICYNACGVALARCTSAHCIPSFFVTGNNYKHVYNSLSLDTREVTNIVTIPAKSLCYLVPFCMDCGQEGKFILALYKIAGESYTQLSIEKLSVPGMDWAHPAEEFLELEVNEKDRVDFYVDAETDIHILLHQDPQSERGTGNSALTENYVGMYLYDDTDKKIGGVAAATNYRESSILHHLPRSGRYAISVTCPRARGVVPVGITIIGSPSANVRIVDTPEDACVFDDEDIIESGDVPVASNLVDDTPMNFASTRATEVPVTAAPFEDKRFMSDNRSITNDPWIRICDLYPEGKTQPLIPDRLSRDQFKQGEQLECCCLTAFATLVDHHPDVIRNLFVTKDVREDGRYTFQFHRYSQWVNVEIDDRIPMSGEDTLYCCSPSCHWWPLLLEKAYAKFYTGYENLEGCTLQEVYHDMTGCPVLSIPMDARLAKAAGADVMDGRYWLDLAQRIRSGQVVASVLTNDMKLENMGLQPEQQYGILEIFSLTGGSSVSDIVVHLHNPFEDEEFLYTGPLNSEDPQWTPELRARYAVDDEHSAFIPLGVFHKIINSMQLCYVSSIESEAICFDDEWKGKTAGGNPTCVTWRNNPLYTVRNASARDTRFLVMIKQGDKRHSVTGDEEICYNACGVALARCTSAHCIPSFFVTGNNYKHVYNSLSLDTREVTNIVTIPAKSLCYLVPFCMDCGQEGKFILALYKIAGESYTQLSIEKLSVPGMDWAHPAEEFLELEVNEKDRVDFYVDAETDIHILMHQDPQSERGTGNSALTENYVGMYLYDDTDKKIGGVAAATNYRESSILHHLPRSGRYAISVTCPRAKDVVPIGITIIGSPSANVRIVDTPEDACVFDDEDIIESGDAPVASNLVDDTPMNFASTRATEVPVTAAPFEDKRFMSDKRSITNDPWIRICDLYPEGKTQPLIPDRLSRDQFEQGEQLECCCLTAFATLVDHHPDVIRNLFVTKDVREDGRYTFQFHRYGQWVNVEIDDRIPMSGEDTLYCCSPSCHWWPLLLEKAYAKFYTGYENLEGCSLGEVFYDFTGHPVISIPTNTKLARSISYDVDEPEFWLGLNQNLNTTALGAFTGRTNSGTIGLVSGQSYGVIGVFALKESKDISLSDLVVKIYNPYHDSVYTGPMNRDDHKWTSEHRLKFSPERPDVIYMPVDVFCDVFESVQQAYIKGLQEPGWHFNSEWGEGTNGGNPGLVTWRENPLYVVRNTSDKPIGIVGLICQPDQRHKLHSLPSREMEYHSAVLVLAQKKQKADIPTFLVTFNNHRIIFKGLFSNCREVASFMVVPPKSLCYLVPSCMGQEKSKFLLSYWLTNRVADQSLGVVRYRPDVARNLSAIKHLELHNKEQDRVDFLVDVPTDIHILLRQEKPFTSPGGDDIIAEDFVGMYLYDENNKRIGGVSAAMNYREIGIVHHLASAGRYALSITCPRGNGAVPVKVEVVGVEHARVRITDPPEDSGDLMEVDLGFLDQDPQGVPLSDLPVDEDDVFQSLLANLKDLCKDPEKNEARIAEDKRRLNERVNALAKQVIAEDRATYLSGHDLEALNPLLDADENYMNKERQRYALKNDPRNETKMKNIEGDLRKMADAIAEHARNSRLDLPGPHAERMPMGDVPHMADEEFNEVSKECAYLRSGTVVSVSKTTDREVRMHARDHKLPNQMQAGDRVAPVPEPEGVPLHHPPVLTDHPSGEVVRERMKLCLRPPNPPVLPALESSMNSHVLVLAHHLIKSGQTFLDRESTGVPTADVSLNSDERFQERGELHRDVSQGSQSTTTTKEIDSQINLISRDLAATLPEEKRELLSAAPHDILLEDRPLSKDLSQQSESKQYAFHANAGMYAEKSAMSDVMMKKRVYDIATGDLKRDRHYLDLELAGVALEDLPLDTDKLFHQMELDRRTLQQNNENGKKDEEIAVLEEKLRRRAIILANQFVLHERAYLDQCPEGVPLERLPLGEDREFRELELERRRLVRNKEKNAPRIAEVERLLRDRVRVLALGHHDWEDPEFHEANKDMAELWPRIVHLYMEGHHVPFEPSRTHPSDVRSAPGAAGYLAPFIAALARSPSLISRLIYTKSHPINAPYSFIFYDFDCAPVRVDIDDRVPCDANMEPKFTQVPNRSWYPLLLEKAYAKFVGGYKKMDFYTPHEILRDLTGKPVLHISFDKKLAACTGMTGFTTTKFWMGVASALERGDLFTCMACIDTLDGIHSHCIYTLLDIIQTVEKSNHPADIVIKLYNCYHDEPFYSGPLCIGSPNWTKDLRWLCSYDPGRTEYIYMPLPTFLRNFASIQWCNVNCGGRLTAQGEWKSASAGGNPEFTSFRKNPIFLVENKMSHPTPIIVELRHHFPVYFDANGLGHYHQTGLVLMQAAQAQAPVTPLLTVVSHEFLYKSFLLNAREVSAQMVLPANTTCYLIPYTLKPGSVGRFSISVYPGMAKVTLSPLLTDSLTPSPICTKLNIEPGDNHGQRADFQVPEACDVHILLRQERMDALLAKRGDIWGDTELQMSVYDERGMKLVSTGCAINAREHSLAFTATTASTFSVVIHSPSSASPQKCPCTLSVYTPKHVSSSFVPVPPNARPLKHLSLPTELSSGRGKHSKQSFSNVPQVNSTSVALPSILRTKPFTYL